MVKRKLTKIFRSKATVDNIINLNQEIISLFLKGLPAKISLETLIYKWGQDWKKIESDDFLYALDEITRQALNKIKNRLSELDNLLTAWLSTTSPRLRWHLRNKILSALKIKQTKISPNQILIILNNRKVKFTLEQWNKLVLILNYQNYPKQ